MLLQHKKELITQMILLNAFPMYATTIQVLMDIADAGKVMFPKSTWFEPQLRSALFVLKLK